MRTERLRRTATHDKVSRMANATAPQRPNRPHLSRQATIRLPSPLVRRLEGEVERLTEATPGGRFCLSDAVRTLLTEALDRRDRRGA